MMKDAAGRTANTAGDGTTTAIVLTEAIVKAGQEYIEKGSNVAEIIRCINKCIEKIIHNLTVKSKKVNESRLLDVACISANNDKEIGKIIADAYTQVGVNGIVTVENSMTSETYAEVTNGIKVARGYTSNMFINNQKKDECVLEGVKILVCDAEISSVLQIENVLKPIIQNNDKLLIIGPCHGNVINTLAANVVRNGLKFCNIIPPNFGYKSTELMSDIAFAVNAKFFSEKTGDDLSLIRMEDLGYADKIVSNNESTIIFKTDEKPEETQKRIDELKIQQENTTIKHERDFINERIASLAGAIGCIYVGGNSDVEQKELYDRVDDSVCAVRSALDEGIIAGGGLSLLRESIALLNKSTMDNKENANIARLLLASALQAPINQICKNADIDVAWIMEHVYTNKYNYGFDVKNEKYGDMFKLGIIDPLKVTKNALLNAVSVATTILSTNAIITHKRQGQSDD